MLFPYSNHSSDRPSLEISEEFSDVSAKPRLPRHISTLASETHSSMDRLSKTNYNKRIFAQNSSCPQNPAINLAVSISQYQLSDRPLRQKHLENLRGNLQHRLEVAVAGKNSQLVSMLQQEFRQLEANV